MGFLFLLLIVQGILIGTLCSYVASQKNRSKRNWFFLGFLFSFLALVALAAIPSLPKQEEGQETANRRYCDERNIQLEKYQLFLTEKYSIQKNATLEKYVIGDSLFGTLEDALKYANDKEIQEEIQEEKQIAYERLRNAYLISYVAENSNACSSGIKVNDILMTYNGIPITNDQDISEAITSISKPNTSLVVLRGGKQIELTVNSGRLGIVGSVVLLDANAHEKRVKKFMALDSIV